MTNSLKLIVSFMGRIECISLSVKQAGGGKTVEPIDVL